MPALLTRVVCAATLAASPGLSWPFACYIIRLQLDVNQVEAHGELCIYSCIYLYLRVISLEFIQMRVRVQGN